MCRLTSLHCKRKKSLTSSFHQLGAVSTSREEHPSSKKIREGEKNFSFALHAEISAEVVTKWRRKRRITIGLEQLNERPADAMFILFVSCTRIFQAKVVYMALRSSQC